MTEGVEAGAKVAESLADSLPKRIVEGAKTAGKVAGIVGKVLDGAGVAVKLADEDYKGAIADTINVGLTGIATFATTPVGGAVASQIISRVNPGEKITNGAVAGVETGARASADWINVMLYFQYLKIGPPQN